MQWNTLLSWIDTLTWNVRKSLGKENCRKILPKKITQLSNLKKNNKKPLPWPSLGNLTRSRWLLQPSTGMIFLIFLIKS